MRVIEAKDVEEAIEIALQLRESGEYDWFRGQVRDWLPETSLQRKLKSGQLEIADYTARLEHVLTWMRKVPELKYLAEPEKVNELCAVLQHYGFPTNYIDFTTDPAVAGFFSADTINAPEDGGQSVIYCLNTSDLLRLYSEGIAGPAYEVETITVDVDNLWRLKAQAGHFVYTNHDWYRIYDMDRIVFPWTGPPAYPRAEHIYPLHKSPLERRLDDFFQLERQREARKQLDSMTAAGTNPFLMYEVNVPPYDREKFVSALQILDSWAPDELQTWTDVQAHHFPPGPTYSMNLKLRNDKGAPTWRSQIASGLNAVLRSDPTARMKPVDWTVTLPDGETPPWLDRSIRDIWNGMRSLPFSDAQVTSAISMACQLIIDLHNVPNASERSVIKGAFEDAMEVDFGTRTGPGSRGYCSSAKLLSAIDSDWWNSVSAPELVIHARDALQKSHSPALMFRFGELVNIFADEIIPSQALLRREAVVFSPAELDTLGLP